MLNRRSFLIACGIMATGSLLGSCSNNSQSLKVKMLQSSIPPQLLKQFAKKIKQKISLQFSSEKNLINLYSLLENWQESTEQKDSNFDFLPLSKEKKYHQLDLISLGNYWLSQAIQEELIEPLNIQNLNNWQKLPDIWHKLVQRNETGKLVADGFIWAAPYRWGTTAIAYRADKLKELAFKPEDWQDLWQNELKRKICLLDQPREIIGLTLKKLGYSYNLDNIDSVTELESELLALHQQVKFYSSDYYLQPLILGDAWLAVGWSADILAVARRYQNIKMVVPKSGTALWADLWVQPRRQSSPEKLEDEENLANAWINFCWDTKSAQQISLFSYGVSPLLSREKPEDIPKDLRQRSDLILSSDIMAKSEFIEPLSREIEQKYVNLWQKIRNS